MIYSKYHNDNSFYVKGHCEGNTANSYMIANNINIQHAYHL